MIKKCFCKYILGVFLVFWGVSCSERQEQIFTIGEKINIDIVSKAKQIFVLDTLSLSNILVVDNIDSINWYDKYVLFYDNNNKLVGYVYTETLIDSIIDGCVYFTEPMQKHNIKTGVWPNVISKKVLPYRPLSVTTYDDGIVVNYSIHDSDISFIIIRFDEPLSQEEIERRATKGQHKIKGCEKIDSMSIPISNLIFDFGSIALTPREHIDRLRFRRVAVKKGNIFWRFTIHEDIEALINEDLLKWLFGRGTVQ